MISTFSHTKWLTRKKAKQSYHVRKCLCSHSEGNEAAPSIPYDREALRGGAW